MPIVVSRRGCRPSHRASEPRRTLPGQGDGREGLGIELGLVGAGQHKALEQLADVGVGLIDHRQIVLGANLCELDGQAFQADPNEHGHALRWDREAVELFGEHLLDAILQQRGGLLVEGIELAADRPLLAGEAEGLDDEGRSDAEIAQELDRALVKSGKTTNDDDLAFAEIDEQIIFKSGEEGYSNYRIPAVITAVLSNHVRTL